MEWEDRGWVLVDEHPAPDLAESALGIFQQSKIQPLTRFHCAMGMLILTSRTCRALYTIIATFLMASTPCILLLGEESHLAGVN